MKRFLNAVLAMLLVAWLFPVASIPQAEAYAAITSTDAGIQSVQAAETTAVIRDVVQVISKTLGTSVRVVPEAQDFHDVFGIEPVDDDLAPRDEAVEDAVTAAIDELQAFFQSLGMPATLRDFGLAPDDVDPLLETLRQNKGEAFGAFQKLTLEDARAIYLSAF